MTVYSPITCEGGNPEALLVKPCDELTDGCCELVIIRYTLDQYWLDRSPELSLIAYYHLAREHGTIVIHFAVAEAAQGMSLLDVSIPSDPWDAFQYVAQQLSLPVFSAHQPIPLISVNIAKPWGQEVWFTGIEQRGVAGAGSANQQSPLPHVLSALPGKLCGNRHRHLILLKILDPLPEEIFGDLYFELHQEKREVYVVTHVDPLAWPGGEGAIRFGFCAKKRQGFSSDKEFRQAFLSAVSDYEITRREIDQLIDRQRSLAGLGDNEPVDADQLKALLSLVPMDLTREELKKRQYMESFTDSLPLSVGDVIKVPCLTPHSLQHGVRTIEFQTPVYERLIVSFAQKVLTQQHWDTEEAVKLMLLEQQSPEAHMPILVEPGLDIQRIVDFEDFEVRRVSLDSGISMSINSPESYGVLMAIDHGIVIDGSLAEPESALLLPGSCHLLVLTNSSPKTACFLLAFPK